MNIAGLSMGLSQMKLAQEVSVSVMKMAMENGENHMNDLLQMIDQNVKIMEQSINPHIGGSIDLRL